MKQQFTAILGSLVIACQTRPNEVNQMAENVKAGHETILDSSKYLVEKGNLTGKTVRLDVSYAAVSCPCPQWYETKNANQEGNVKEHFYLEPADLTLIQADTLFNGEYFPVRISVTGEFYSNLGYPKNFYSTKGHAKPARVFRYNQIAIIQRGKP